MLYLNEVTLRTGFLLSTLQLAVVLLSALTTPESGNLANVRNLLLTKQITMLDWVGQ